MIYKKSLSVVIITFNEAKLLAECLTSVNWANEIIVLDSGSQDETCNIATQAGARVFQSNKEEWLGFGIQRQRAQLYANGDYILMLDADERVTPQLRKSIITILQSPTSGVVYRCVRRNLFFGKIMKHDVLHPDKIVRFYSRKEYYYNTMSIHESLNTKGAKIITLKGYLLHFACCDLLSFQCKQLRYAAIWAKMRYVEKRKCSFFAIIIHSYSAFFKTWLLHASFLDGKKGYLLAIIKAQYTFNKYAMLWLYNTRKKYKQ